MTNLFRLQLYRQTVRQLMLALGGKQNLARIDACITHLRLEIVSMNDVQETELKKLGAMGGVKRGDSGLQIIVGTQAEIIAGEIC